jgi:hypothetical protein
MNEQPITFSFRGQQVTAEQFEAMTTPAKKRVPKSGPDAYHRGYRVVGHPPGAMESAHEAADEAIGNWRVLPQSVKSGMKEPKPFNEDQWRRNTGKKVAKTTDLHEPALLAAEIARKSGWIDVDVIELKKGEKPDSWA